MSLRKKLLITSLILFGFFSSLFLSSVSPTSEIEHSQCDSSQDLFLGPVNKFCLESPDFLLVQKNSLRASLPPITISPKALGALVGSEDLNPPRRGIIEYVVESGDNLWTIASDFEISLNSLLWANDLTTKSLLKVGQKLVIPPISGVIHHVRSGDTISGIAQTYKAETADIISFNDLTQEGDIFLGDILVVPNGEMPPPQKTYQPQYAPLASSYFICPIASPCRITQGLHWYNAIDFSHGKCGEPIFAAAAGEVLKVRLTTSTYRWVFGGAGNHLTILHPNGVVTYYGHIATSLVNPGDQVSQGEIIALMGGKTGTPGAGNSTGCHVHFAVSGARNPFAK